MKSNIIKKTLTVLLAVLFVLPLFSCGDTPVETNAFDWSEYCFVIPSYFSHPLSVLFNDVKTKCLTICGKEPKTRNEQEEEQLYEVYLPGCQAAYEKADGLKIHDYSILFEETKIYIVTATSGGEVSSLKRFIAEVLTENPDFKPGDRIDYVEKTRFSSLTVNGKDISAYTLFCDNDDKEMGNCNRLNLLLIQYMGIELKVLHAAAYRPEKYPCAILFGECGGISEGITENIGVRECAFRSQGTTLAVAPASNSLLLFYEFLHTFPGAQLGSLPYNAAANLVTDEYPEHWEADILHSYTSSSNTCVMISESKKGSSDLSKIYESYRKKPCWSVWEHPDIVLLTNPYIYRFFDDGGPNWYNRYGNVASSNSYPYYLILSRKERYTHVAGDFTNYCYWEVLSDSVLQKNVLAVAAHCPDDPEKSPAMISSLLRTIEELKGKYGEDIPVILGISGSAFASDAIYDPIREKMTECAAAARISSDAQKGTRRTGKSGPSDESEPRDLIFVSPGIDVYTHKVYDCTEEDALPVLADVEIR